MSPIPVYDIKNFDLNTANSELYVNSFKNHFKAHPFVEKPHRHNFYLLVLFTHGSGFHEIDFNHYTIKRGSLFVIQPGQMHSWQLSTDCDGYIVFFAQELYNLYFGNKNVEEYAFLKSVNAQPEMVLEADMFEQVNWYFSRMFSESQSMQNGRLDIILNLLDTIQVLLARQFSTEEPHQSPLYNHKLRQFKMLLEQSFVNEKSPSYYAAQMNISPKHLNRICQTILGKTPTEIITARVILEAKRMLINPKKSISQVADVLNFVNYSHFTKLFKKQTGISPGEFRKIK